MTHWFGSRCRRSNSWLAEAPVAVTASANARAALRNILSFLHRPSVARLGRAIVPPADDARRRTDSGSCRRPPMKLLGRLEAPQASSVAGAAHVFGIVHAGIVAGRGAAISYLAGQGPLLQRKTS